MQGVREKRDDLRARVPIMRLAVMGVMVVLVACYWFVQVVRGDYYRGLADNNRIRTLPLQAPRGLIFDRDGELLVENVPSYNLFLDRDRSGDPERALGFAAEVLDWDREEFAEALGRRGPGSRYRPVLVAEALSLSEVARFQVSALEYPEFEVDVGHLRLYRHGRHVAHPVGHLGEVTEGDLQSPDSPYRPGDLVGKKGVEGAFDLELRGRDGESIVTVDSRGRVREESDRRMAKPGRALALTLDLELQQEAARYFEAPGGSVEGGDPVESGMKVGAAVAMDPATGEIRALVSSPSFDPNLFSRRLNAESWRALVEDPYHPLQNRALQSAYSPGSIFKIVVAVGGLTDRLVGREERVFCGGSTRIYNRRFRCWKRAGHGWMDLRSAIKESCDVYFYHLGQKLGIERIAHYARLMGLGRPTGIDVGGEKEGLVPDPDWSLRRRGTPWYPGETISVAIGQGPLLVTPIQMAAFMATVANGGYRVTPRLVQAGASQEPERLEIDPEALAVVRDALNAVVDERGTGAAARVPGLKVSGKTGTVQVIHQKTWVDSADLPYEFRDHAWFASFASGGERELVVVVFVEHGGKGSQAAAPLARILYESYFRDILGLRAAS